MEGVMHAALSPETVLAPASHCVVREQEQQFLIYNNRTDELHLMSPTGWYVYRLCDGLRTLGEIQQQLGMAAGAHQGTLDPRLDEFASGLLTRKVLEVSSDE
jgi:hypothetical protein